MVNMINHLVAKESHIFFQEMVETKNKAIRESLN